MLRSTDIKPLFSDLFLIYFQLKFFKTVYDRNRVLSLFSLDRKRKATFYAPDSGIPTWTSDFGLRTSPTSDFRLPTSDFGLPAPRIPDSGVFFFVGDLLDGLLLLRLLPCCYWIMWYTPWDTLSLFIFCASRIIFIYNIYNLYISDLADFYFFNHAEHNYKHTTLTGPIGVYQLIYYKYLYWPWI